MSNHTVYYDDKSDRYYARIQVGNVRKRFWFGSNRKEAREDLKKTLKKIAGGNTLCDGDHHSQVAAGREEGHPRQGTRPPAPGMGTAESF